MSASPTSVEAATDRDWDAAERQAWNWFQMHGAQRMQLVNFFLVGGAFLTAGVGAALEARLPWIALAVSLAGAAVSIYFWLLEVRTKALVKLGEEALMKLEERLADRTGFPEIELKQAQLRRRRFRTYGQVIPCLYASALIGFLIAATWTLLTGL